MGPLGLFRHFCFVGALGLLCKTATAHGQGENACNSQPCQNGGTCVAKTDGFECKCSPFDNGALCENRWFKPDYFQKTCSATSYLQIAVPALRDCSHIKDINPTAPSGVYTIQPTGQAPFKVYCDMSETIGWTKVLQFPRLYTVSASAVGNVAVGSDFDAVAKLSDASTNAIIRRLKQTGEPGAVHYRIKVKNSDDRLYMKTMTSKSFSDLAAAWGVFQGEREQCFQRQSLQACAGNYKKVNYHTLDTLHDMSRISGSHPGVTGRFFTDHDGPGTTRRCYIPYSQQRCLNSGVDSLTPWLNVELWVGK